MRKEEQMVMRKRRDNKMRDKEGGADGKRRVVLVAGRRDTASWHGDHLPWLGLST